MIPFTGCPHCGSTRFAAGPRGGSSQNVTCLGCSARLNLIIPPQPGPLLLLDELSGPTGKPADSRGAGYVIEIPAVTELHRKLHPERNDNSAPFICPRCGATSHNPHDAEQRYCARCHAFVDDDLWVVWSEEHEAWWGPGHTGYAQSLERAGRYTEQEAAAIEARANRYLPTGTYHEIAMPDPRATWRRVRGL